MTAIAIEQVRPAGARYEGLAMLLAAMAVTGTLALYVVQRGNAPTAEPLQEWQISAFDGLTGADQAIYNALYTIKDDVPYIYDDINMMNAPGEKFRWPGIEDFQEYLLPPFYRDGSWEQNGSLQWSLHEPLAEGEMQGSVMYLGTGGSLAGQGSFLLVIGHVHAGFQNNNAIAIWWNPQSRVELPGSAYRDSLILQGWREVVPHSGADEFKRIFGEDARGEDPATGEQSDEEVIDELFDE